MAIRFLQGARNDFIAAAAFYESEAKGLSAEFVAIVDDAGAPPPRARFLDDRVR